MPRVTSRTRQCSDERRRVSCNAFFVTAYGNQKERLHWKRGHGNETNEDTARNVFQRRFLKGRDWPCSSTCHHESHCILCSQSSKFSHKKRVWCSHSNVKGAGCDIFGWHLKLRHVLTRLQSTFIYWVMNRNRMTPPQLWTVPSFFLFL